MLSLLAACEEPVDLNIDFEERLAVSCHFSVGEPFTVYVSKTLDPLSNQEIDIPGYLRDANVVVYEGDILICEIPFQESQDPEDQPTERYLNESCLAEAGVAYTLKVSAPDLDDVFATDVIPAKAEISDLELFDLEVSPLPNNVATFQFKAKLVLEAPTEEAHYYFLNFNYERIDFQVNGNDTTFQKTGDYEALELEGLEGNPPSLKDFDEEQQGILFANEGSAPLELNFQLNSPEVSLTSDLFDQVYVNLRTVSKSYYDYHVQLSRQLSQKDTFLVNPVILADNIENGYGIFAGYQLTKDSLLVE